MSTGKQLLLRAHIAKQRERASEMLTELTGRTAGQIEEARASVRAGDLAPIKDLLYDSALLLHGAALTSIKMASSSIAPNPGKNIDNALKAVETCKQIFVTLAEHTNADTLSGIASTVFQDNLEKIMRYIARKGGAVKRYELLTSRVIQGNAMDYDKVLAALVDNRYISATQTGRRKEITYSIITCEQPLIEVLSSGMRGEC